MNRQRRIPPPGGNHDPFTDYVMRALAELLRFAERSDRRWEEQERRWKEQGLRWESQERRWEAQERRWDEERKARRSEHEETLLAIRAVADAAVEAIGARTDASVHALESFRRAQEESAKLTAAALRDVSASLRALRPRRRPGGDGRGNGR